MKFRHKYAKLWQDRVLDSGLKVEFYRELIIYEFYSM